MEQLVILLLIALISFINWLVKKSAELREERKREKGGDRNGGGLRSEAPPPPLPETEPDISMRRLREALGLPEEVEPPALPRRIEQRVPPPLPAPPPPRPAKTIVSHGFPAPVRDDYRFLKLPAKIMKPAASKTEAARDTSRIRELLSSSGGLRDAVVLSEILGPPRSLRATQR